MLIKKLLDYMYRYFRPIRYWKKKGLKIGNSCEILKDVDFGTEPYLVSIGDHVRISSGTRIVTHDGGVWAIRWLNEEYKNIDLFAPVRIGNNCSIGMNVLILPGTVIGDNCIIGAGALVKGSIPDNSIAVGVPARVIETIDDYKIKHINDFDFTKDMDAKDKKDYLLNKYF